MENSGKLLSVITVFNKEAKKFYEFSRLNLIFGYAGSGKSTFLSLLSSIFTGKDKHHLVNGTQTVAKDFNVIYLGTDDGISNHLKLSSKSLLRRIIAESKYSDSFDQSCEQMFKGMNQAQEEIEGRIKEILPGSTVKITDSGHPLDFLIDNMTIEIEGDSSSEEKKKLFGLIRSLSSNTAIKTIVLIDDFNDDFDEETTLKFLEEIDKSNAYFFLTTKRSTPQTYLEEGVKIFAMREFEAIPLPDIKTLLLNSLVENQEYKTFEEYITGKGYVENSGLAEMFLHYIQGDEKTNLLRILTAKSPVLAHENIPGKVTIVPISTEEERLYKSVFESLGIPLDQN